MVSSIRFNCYIMNATITVSFKVTSTSSQLLVTSMVFIYTIHICKKVKGV